MIGVIFAVFILMDILLIVTAFVYARFVFSGYLRRHHPTKWNEMVYGSGYQGMNLLAFDKTPALRRFRCESSDDFDDPQVSKMRRISIYLFNTAIITWLGLVVLVLIGGLTIALVLR